jgi:hypothetical protein
MPRLPSPPLLPHIAAEYFYTKVQHLNWMLESIAADIRQGNQPWQGGAIDKAHQLIPIQKFMTRCVCLGGGHL